MKNTHKIVLIFLLFTFFISISSTSLAAPEDVSPVADFAANITMGNAPLKVLFTDQSTGSPTSWLWDFGDGVDSKHAMNATHTFTTPDIYTVTLTVTNAAGSNSVTKAGYITVINNSATEIPVADFTADVTSGPAPLKVQFTSAVTGNPTDYFWVFEPETSSDWNSQQAVTAGHTFKNPGVYSISLSVTNAIGNTIVTKTDYITVTAPVVKPVASFTVDKTTGDIPLTIHFNDTSTGSPTSWNWDFGDGATSNKQNQEHTYFSAGTYNVNLAVSNEEGTDSKTSAITVLGSSAPAPKIDNFEIRSSVYSGSTINDIIANPAYGDGTQITIDAKKGSVAKKI